MVLRKKLKKYMNGLVDRGNDLKLNKKFILAFMTFFIFVAQPEGASKNKNEIKSRVMKEYDNKIPENIVSDIKYHGKDLPELLDYIFIKTKVGNIRKFPSGSSEIIYQLPFNEKLQVLQKIGYEGNKQFWYKVKTPNGIGYISSVYCEERTFQFEKMLGRIKDVENFINENNTAGVEVASTNSYVPNPYNKDMLRKKDKYGTSLDQNIIGKYNDENIYVPDRSVLSIISQTKDKAEVRVEGIKEYPLVIEKKYISRKPVVSEGFKKAIVADIDNQNLAAFEKINGTWVLVSYIYGKTGIESILGFETPRGSFIVPLLKYEMGYRGNYGEDLGIARYAIRFSGGGYLHGTPVDHVEVPNKEFFLNQKEEGLGTFKGTRKCIRNTEEHAKFLFDWILGDKRNINSNDQIPKENVMFIIF